MSERVERAAWLGEQLAMAMRALGEATTTVDVLLFLDRLARLEGLPAGDIDAVPRLRELLATGIAAREAHADALGEAAGRAFDLEHLLESGRHLPPDDTSGERDGWLRDLLVIATVVPWLPRARRGLAAEAVSRAIAMIEAEPEAFLDASGLAEDRQIHERPEGLGSEARAVIEALADVALLVLVDRAGVADEDRVGRAVLASADALEDAEDALLDREIRIGLRRTGRRSVAVYAADAPGMLVCRMLSGAWELVERAGVASLRWSPDNDEHEVSVAILDGQDWSYVLRDARGEFALPPLRAPLRARVVAGPDSRVLVLFEQG